jgi:hypothetical protein
MLQPPPFLFGAVAAGPGPALRLAAFCRAGVIASAQRRGTTMPPEAPRCLSCGEREAQCRGLCVACFGRQAAAVERRQATWEDLEAQGQALPARRKGRRDPHRGK